MGYVPLKDTGPAVRYAATRKPLIITTQDGPVLSRIGYHVWTPGMLVPCQLTRRESGYGRLCHLQAVLPLCRWRRRSCHSDSRSAPICEDSLSLRATLSVSDFPYTNTECPVTTLSREIHRYPETCLDAMTPCGRKDRETCLGLRLTTRLL